MSDDDNKTNDLKYSWHAQTFPSVKNDRIILETRVNWFARDEKKWIISLVTGWLVLLYIIIWTFWLVGRQKAKKAENEEKS